MAGTASLNERYECYTCNWFQVFVVTHQRNKLVKKKKQILNYSKTEFSFLYALVFYRGTSETLKSNKN
jgi:hypothetical protein